MPGPERHGAGGRHLPRTRRGVALVAGAVASAGFVAARFVDPSAAAFMPRCPVAALTGLDCPGCGTGRGLHALANGDVTGAFDFNALVPVVLAVVAGTWLAWVLGGSTRDLLRGVARSRWARSGALALVVAFTVARNLDGPFEGLNSNIPW